MRKISQQNIKISQQNKILYKYYYQYVNGEDETVVRFPASLRDAIN